MSAPAAPAWSASDADIMEQQNELRREVEATQPLVGAREAPEALLQAYAENPDFLPKLHDFAARYASIRRARGDGSCFYRAFLFGVGEYFVRAGVTTAPPPAGQAPSVAQALYTATLAYVRESLGGLLALGYPDVTVPDFQEAMLEYLTSLAVDAPAAAAGGAGAPADADARVEALVARFGDQMWGFYIITYLRCLCSLELLSHEEQYFPFILGLAPHCATVKMFCDAEVDAVSTDADQVQIIALTAAWRVGVRIAYLDAAPGDECRTILFPENAGTPGGPPIVVDLLYRPGHYDLAYCK